MMMFRAVHDLGRRLCTTTSLSSSFFCVDYTISSSRWQCGEQHRRLPQRRSIAATTFAKSSSSIFTVPDNNNNNNNNNNNKVTVDPTAKRSTRKCDPFGLSGKSLSCDECNTWMCTLEKGWTLIIPPPPLLLIEKNDDNDGDVSLSRSRDTIKDKDSRLYAAAPTANPTFLHKHYYHRTFLDASQFITHISSVATNNNHYPLISFERILTSEVVSSSTSKENDMEEEKQMEVEKDVMQQQHLADKVMNEQCKVDDNSSSSSPQTKMLIDKSTGNRRRDMGWIVRSTIQCSTHRPTTASRSTSSDDDNSRGLTYHDFHLALCIDVEVKRNTITQSLLVK